MAAVGVLLECYALVGPAAGQPERGFTNADLQTLSIGLASRPDELGWCTADGRDH